MDVTRLPSPCGTQDNKQLPGLKSMSSGLEAGETLWAAAVGVPSSLVLGVDSIEDLATDSPRHSFLAKTTSSHCPH